MACMKLHSRLPPRNGYLLIIFLLPVAFSLISRLNPSRFLAQGRQLSRLPDAYLRKDQVKAVKIRYLMGSRPPRCDQTKCKNCGQCEAVQVPISPAEFFDQQQQRDYSNTAYSRGDENSNYKPMCWKCKCGNFIFNP